MPSSALTLKGSGYLNPAASRAVTSVASSSRTTIAGRVAELRLGRLVDPGEVVDEEAGVVGHGRHVGGVALVELFEPRAVEADPVEVGEVRILAGLPAAGR